LLGEIAHAKLIVMNEITIRSELATDIKAIEELTIKTFLHAKHTSHTEQFIVSALRKAGMLTVSLVAEIDNKLIGHVAVSPVSISDGSLDWYGLGPISVAPEYQNRGIGSRLMNEALSNLRHKGAAGCVLLGDPNYYSRFGFRADSRLKLRGVPPEYFQALSFGKSTPQGVVTYHNSFNAHD
jgi:putative acetyltransferase